MTLYHRMGSNTQNLQLSSTSYRVKSLSGLGNRKVVVGRSAKAVTRSISISGGKSLGFAAYLDGIR
jgi:hypothetical protein